MQRRDHNYYSDPVWGVGTVTQLEPDLLVTMDDNDGMGYTWDEVRPLPEGWKPEPSPVLNSPGGEPARAAGSTR